MLHAVVMAGGSGTRFWPQSRKTMPKQLLKLAGDRTMIQQTFDRCDGLIDSQQSWVVTNQVQADATSGQLPDIDRSRILVEPDARNTAPCIGLAAVHLLKQDPDAIMFVMPADHVIQPVEKFQQAIQAAVKVVEADPSRLVLFGVPPTFPATGYGYIERAAAFPSVDSAFDVGSFREKPAEDVAQGYLDSGNFYWNCGIFCWRADTILNLLKTHEPDMFDRLNKISGAIGTDSEAAVLAEEFPQMNSISIDYAVLERATGATVIEAPYQWDDVGSWLAVPRLAGCDSSGNTLQGKTLAIDSKDNIVRSTDDHLVAALGVDDLIIVHTPDATLVAKKGDSERIKEILEQLKQDGDVQFL